MNVYSLKEHFFPEPKFRKARIWSNKALRRISPLFRGDIINVSGWWDSDKRGGFYKDYFPNASSYDISNYEEPSNGHQGWEIRLNLEDDLSPALKDKYDVVFNHTTLEHIFEVRKAFQNLCLMTKDTVILVVPWLQQLHYAGGYYDYWRISPFAIKAMFEENGMELVHLDAGTGSKESIYILAVGSKQPDLWRDRLAIKGDFFKNLGNKII